MQIEQDRAKIRSGVRHGLTIGSPIALLIENRDWENWRENMSIEPVEVEVEPVTRLRPGHADLAGTIKYGLDDVRPILERASARETAARVAVGGVAKRLLEEFGVRIRSHTVSIRGIWAQIGGEIDWDTVEESPVRCADPDAARLMIEAIDSAREAGDSVGGVFEVVASGVPIGLGSHVHWDRRLDGRLAAALMSINAVKGVEIGAGFAGSERLGSQVHDVILPRTEWGESEWPRASNRAGGIEAGMSNGQDIVVRAALKPIPTLANPLPSADLHTAEEIQAHKERSDVCVVPAGGVVGEAMVAIVLAQAMLGKFGGDNLSETKRNYAGYISTTGPRGQRG
jgi:chorismate synthase